jgi:hypothetical protein
MTSQLSFISTKVFPDVKSENKLLIYCPFMKKIYGGHMGKYGGHMGISLELNFGHMGKYGGHMGKYGGHMGKYGGHMGKNGEPIFDLGHMGISLELNSGKIMADIWELPQN